MQWADRVGRRVKLRDLHMLMAVAQSGSIAKAAQQLAISHPVVPKTISDLEHTLGVRLLDRSSRGVRPTMYGEALLKCGVAVFNEMRQGIRHVEFLADPTVGNLRFGCSEAMAAGLIPAVAERFWRQYPGVSLDIYPAHVMSRKSFGRMTRKLSVTESQIPTQSRGTLLRRKPSAASANWVTVG